MHGTITRCCAGCMSAKSGAARCTCQCQGRNHGIMRAILSPPQTRQFSFADMLSDPRTPSLFDIPQFKEPVMANTVVPIRPQPDTAALIESVIIRGDLSGLTPDERSKYYIRVCETVGLNPLTKPLEHITLNGKLTLYALKSCTEQLRSIHRVSVTELTEADWDGVFMVTAKVQNGEGRTDMAKGAVALIYPDKIKDKHGNWINHPKAGQPLKGDDFANALMKAETKAKRRATLSICGLAVLDEVEVDDMREAGNPAISAKETPKEAPRTTLPKKDARPLYIKLQAEIDACPNSRSLNEWGEATKERIALLPPDWQEILRLRYKAAMLMLRQQENNNGGDVVWDDNDERPPMPEDFPLPY